MSEPKLNRSVHILVDYKNNVCWLLVKYVLITIFIFETVNDKLYTCK